MKISLKPFFFLAIVWTGTIYAQGYEPMLRDSTKWNVFRQLVGADDDVTYFTQSDSLIAGKNYTLINSMAEKNLLPSDSAFVREDTVLKRVYYRDFNSGPEKLLYDFSLNAGDTVYLKFKHLSFDSVGFMVDSVYIIQTLAGSRKAIKLTSLNTSVMIGVQHDNLNTNSDGLLWIEGYGASNGPLYLSEFEAIPFFFFYDALLCQSTFGIQNYQNPASGNLCQFNFVGLADEVNKTNKIKSIGPNPFSESITIRLNKPEEFKITLYNIHGAIYASEKLQSISEYQLTLNPSLPNGVYILKIHFLNENNFNQFKIIKQ